MIKPLDADVDSLVPLQNEHTLLVVRNIPKPLQISQTFTSLSISSQFYNSFLCLVKKSLDETILGSYHRRSNIIYQQLGADYADRIIAPTIQESVKASVAKFNAEELITKRATAKAVIAETIAKTSKLITLAILFCVVESGQSNTLYPLHHHLPLENTRKGRYHLC